MAPDKSVPAAVDAFVARTTVVQVEEGFALAPKFDADGLIPCITTDANTDEVLMLGYMNGEALQRTIATGEAYYWSRSRQCLWRKGATSGLVSRKLSKRASTTTRTPSGCASGSPVRAPVVTSDTVPASTGRLSSAATPMDLLGSCSRSQRKSFDPEGRLR